MREQGYHLKCARCGREEFVSRKNYPNSGWKDVNLVCVSADEPLDICPLCAQLFRAMYETFFSSFESGVICYTMDGYPVVFDPDALTYKEVNEPREAETEKIGVKEFHGKHIIPGAVYLTNADDIKSVTPDFLNKKFNVKEDEDDE